jgi:hypothetical protein
MDYIMPEFLTSGEPTEKRITLGSSALAATRRSRQVARDATASAPTTPMRPLTVFPTGREWPWNIEGRQRRTRNLELHYSSSRDIPYLFFFTCSRGMDGSICQYCRLRGQRNKARLCRNKKGMPKQGDLVRMPYITRE